MLPTDLSGRKGVAKPLPDKINVREPVKDDEDDFFNLAKEPKQTDN